MLGARRPACSIVIRCCNEERHIGRLLDGIGLQSIRDAEVVVVDSGSTDRTLDVVSRYAVTLIQIAPEEFSFGRALNRGLAAASADVVVVASAHTYPVFEDWLERLVRPFQDPDVGLVYGKQRGDDRTRYSERQVFAAWFGDQRNVAQSHPFCNNANAAVRRAAWERQPYDETLTGLEDIAWARGAMALGYRVCYEPAAEVVHVHEETPRRLYNRYRREAIAFKRIYPEERFHLGDFLRLLVGNIASDLYHAAHDRMLLRNLASIPMFRLMQFLGTYRGFARRAPLTSRLKQTFYYPRSRVPAGDGGRGTAKERQRIEYTGRGHAADTKRSG